MKSDMELLRRIGALREALAAGDDVEAQGRAARAAALKRVVDPVRSVLLSLGDARARAEAGAEAVYRAIELLERAALDEDDREAFELLAAWPGEAPGADSPTFPSDSAPAAAVTPGISAIPSREREDALAEAALLLAEADPEDRDPATRAALLVQANEPAGSDLHRGAAAVVKGAEAGEADWDHLRNAFEAALSTALAPGSPAPEAAPAVAGHHRRATDAPLVPPEADRSLLEDFLEEAADHLGGAEEALLALEADPSDMEAVNVVFRAFHTVKGVAGFLELAQVSEVAHHAETLLARVREGEIIFQGEVADVTLRAADLLRALFAGIRSVLEGGPEPGLPPLYSSLVRRLMEMGEARVVAGGDGPPSPQSPARLEAVAGGGGDDEAASFMASGGREASVRVRTERLDRLVDLVGELVIAQSMVAQDPAVEGEGGELSRKVARASKILRDLQDLSTSMRMVPLKPAFLKVSRVVRDVGRRSGKRVEFVASGEDTEIDRSMVDILADPLIHMVRNSVDHGIESAEERRAAGKPEHGTVRLHAYQASGRVVVEVSDDGRGLDRDRILAKARERRLVDHDRGLSDAEVFALIFEPGFSTAEKVTDISGRGVGMDVVRRSVESLRGRVDVVSEPGKGSTFIIQLPLTLAITDGMLVRVGSQRYILPTTRIQTCFRPAAEDLSQVLGQGEMVRLHDDLFPLVRLHRINGVHDAEEDPTRAVVVVAGEANRRVALLVDELVGQQQFVVKALTGAVARVPGVSGGSILGDGTVGLILDPDELSALARAGEVTRGAA